MGTRRPRATMAGPQLAEQGELAMSYDPQQQHDAASGPPLDQGPPGAARAANLLVGVTVVCC